MPPGALQRLVQPTSLTATPARRRPGCATMLLLPKQLAVLQVEVPPDKQLAAGWHSCSPPRSLLSGPLSLLPAPHLLLQELLSPQKLRDFRGGLYLTLLTVPSLARGLADCLGFPASGCSRPQQINWQRACGLVAAAAEAARGAPGTEQQRAWLLQRELALASGCCGNLSCPNLAGSSEAALNMLRCSGCRTICFCSRWCSKAAWRSHRPACRMLTERAAVGEQEREPEQGPEPAATAAEPSSRQP